MAEKNTADIGFEKQIWDAACVLRGNMDASEYKNVVLGLIFLKYISDRFDEKHRELVAEGDGSKKILMSIHPKESFSFLLVRGGTRFRLRRIHRKLALSSMMPCGPLRKKISV